MTDKFVDPKSGKELFRINNDNTMKTTEEGTELFLIKDVEYWEDQVADSATSRAQEALEIAKSRLKRFKEGKK